MCLLSNAVLISAARFSVSFANSVTGATIAANGTTYTDPFNATSIIAINGQDNVSILPGRSIMLSLTFGLSPKER